MTFLTPDWPAPSNVRAAMSTRQGGVSVGSYASLNLGAGVSDDPAHVAENRRRLIAALDLPSAPVWLKQVHAATVLRLEREPLQNNFPSPPESGERVRVRGKVGQPPLIPALSPQEGRERTAPEADASFTTEPGVVCAVMAADCLPVLFCDDAGSVVAAAHAGWRGLSAGVLEETVRALPVKPGSLMAWMGAAIGPESFEVGADVRDAFVSQHAGAAACFKPLPASGKFLADLYSLARQRLASAGVLRVYGGGRCTLREPEQFFSHRRDGRCGRMAALVWRR